MEYKKMLIANTSGDLLGVMIGHLTHGKIYQLLGCLKGIDCYTVLNDYDVEYSYHKSWFNTLYDEDEGKLTCRKVKFKEDDYLVLSKHTEEQLTHISKHYQIFDLEDTLCEGSMWSHLVWDVEDDFVACSDDYIDKRGEYLGKEYHYNDLFYDEDEG